MCLQVPFSSLQDRSKHGNNYMVLAGGPALRTDRPQMQWTLQPTAHPHVLRWDLGRSVHGWLAELESAGCRDTGLATVMRQGLTRRKHLFLCTACATQFSMDVVALATARPVPWVSPEQGPNRLTTRHTPCCPHLTRASAPSWPCQCGVSFDSARALAQHQHRCRPPPAVMSAPQTAPLSALDSAREEAVCAISRLQARQLAAFRAQSKPAAPVLALPAPRQPRQDHLSTTHSSTAVLPALPNMASSVPPMAYTYRTVLAPRPTALWLQKATVDPFRTCDTRAEYRTALMGPTIWVGLVAAQRGGPESESQPEALLPLVLPECCPWASTVPPASGANTGCQIYPCKNRLSREIPVATVDGFRLVKLTEFLCTTHRPSQDATFNWCSRGVRVPALPPGGDGVVFQWEGLEIATSSRSADTSACDATGATTAAGSPEALPATQARALPCSPANSRAGARGLFWDTRLFRWLVHMFRANPCATRVGHFLHMHWDHRLHERRARLIRKVRAAPGPPSLADRTAAATDVLLYVHELHHQLRSGFVMDLVWYWWCEEGQNEYRQFMSRCQQVPDVQTHTRPK